MKNLKNQKYIFYKIDIKYIIKTLMTIKLYHKAISIHKILSKRT